MIYNGVLFIVSGLVAPCAVRLFCCFAAVLCRALRCINRVIMMSNTLASLLVKIRYSFSIPTVSSSFRAHYRHHLNNSQGK